MIHFRGKSPIDIFVSVMTGCLILAVMGFILFVVSLILIGGAK